MARHLRILMLQHSDGLMSLRRMPLIISLKQQPILKDILEVPLEQREKFVVFGWHNHSIVLMGLSTWLKEQRTRLPASNRRGICPALFQSSSVDNPALFQSSFSL